jgi:hypothetical protein
VIVAAPNGVAFIRVTVEPLGGVEVESAPLGGVKVSSDPLGGVEVDVQRSSR